MKGLKEIVSKNIDSDVKTELLCKSIEEWIIDEFAPEVQKWAIEDFAPEIQGWIIKEFSPQIENWVKEYKNDKRTQLHIKDFCVNDSNNREETPVESSEESDSSTIRQGKMTKEEKKIVRKALELAYQVIKKEAEVSRDFECFRETLIDNYLEWDNGYSNYLVKEIEEKWNDEKL